jgi:HNH endonuclease
MALFQYRKSRHKRKNNPGPYIRYQTYKTYLKQEFDEKCIYCLTPDILKEESFCVEHYKPKSRFKSLETDYSNLYYACLKCNSYKGEFWPTEKAYKLGSYLPNPCDDIMFEHLRYKEVEVVPHSVTGKFAEELLHLNDEKLTKYRRLILVTRDGLKQKINSYEDTIMRIGEKIVSTDDENIKIDLGKDLVSLTSDIDELKDDLLRIDR